jgi:hypothetical protein
MDWKTIVSHMWPCWVLGLAVLFAVAKSDYKALLRIDKKAVAKWGIFMILLMGFRIFTLGHIHSETLKESLQNVSWIPWPMTLTVFWEDACHGLPLAILKKMLGNRWFAKPLNLIALLTAMLSFGSGHVYQGFLAAALIMFYIPFSMQKGEEYGFGTVMLCHMMWDLSTVLSVQWVLRHM